MYRDYSINIFKIPFVGSCAVSNPGLSVLDYFPAHPPVQTIEHRLLPPECDPVTRARLRMFVFFIPTARSIFLLSPPDGWCPTRKSLGCSFLTILTYLTSTPTYRACLSPDVNFSDLPSV